MATTRDIQMKYRLIFRGLLTAILVCAMGTLAYASICQGYLNDYNPNSGPIVASPKVYLVYWDWQSQNDPQNNKGITSATLSSIGGTKYINTITDQYYGAYLSLPYYFQNPANLLQATYVDDVHPITSNTCLPKPCNWPGSQEQATEVLNAIATFNIPVAPDTVIYLLGPPGQRITGPSDAAAHGSVAYGYPSQNVRFVSASYVTGDPSSVVGHELAELVTDPDPTVQFGSGLMTWSGAASGSTNPCGPGNEIADICQSDPDIRVQLLPRSAPVSRFRIPALFSNDGASCVSARATTAHNFYRGGDGIIWHQTKFQNFADPWGRAQGGVNFVSAPAAVSWGVNRIDVFAIDANAHLGHLFTTNGGVSVGVDDWGTLPAPYYFWSKPEVASWGAGRLDVFVRGANFSAGVSLIFHRSWDDGADSGWVPMGALPGGVAINSAPAAVSAQYENANGRLDLDVFVQGDDGILYHSSTVDGAAFTGWESWGSPPSPAVGDPDAASWGPASHASVAPIGPRRLDVFFTAQNGTLLHRWSVNGSNTTGGWDVWNPPAGTTFVAGVAAVGMGDQRLMVSAPTSAGGFAQTIWDFAPKPWTSLTAYFAPQSGSTLTAW